MSSLFAFIRPMNIVLENNRLILLVIWGVFKTPLILCCFIYYNFKINEIGN